MPALLPRNFRISCVAALGAGALLLSGCANANVQEMQESAYTSENGAPVIIKVPDAIKQETKSVYRTDVPFTHLAVKPHKLDNSNLCALDLVPAWNSKTFDNFNKPALTEDEHKERQAAINKLVEDAFAEAAKTDYYYYGSSWDDKVDPEDISSFQTDRPSDRDARKRVTKWTGTEFKTLDEVYDFYVANYSESLKKDAGSHPLLAAYILEEIEQSAENTLHDDNAVMNVKSWIRSLANDYNTSDDSDMTLDSSYDETPRYEGFSLPEFKDDKKLEAGTYVSKDKKTFTAVSECAVTLGDSESSVLDVPISIELKGNATDPYSEISLNTVSFFDIQTLQVRDGAFKVRIFPFHFTSSVDGGWIHTS